MAEQPVVGRLSQRQEQPDLLGRTAEPGAELGHVLRQQRRHPRRPERQPDIGGAQHLGGQRGQALTDLRSEHQAADLAHHAEQRAGSGAGLGRQRPAHRMHHPGGDRVAQRRPDRQRPLHPVHPRPRLGGPDSGRQRRDGVQPVVGQPQRLGHLSVIAGGGQPVPRRQLGDRDLAGQVPVHRPAVPRQQLLQFGEQRHLAGQVGRDVAAEAEQVTSRVTEADALTGSTRFACFIWIGLFVRIRMRPEAERPGHRRPPGAGPVLAGALIRAVMTSTVVPTRCGT